MIELDELRKEIETIDEELAKLLVKRMKLSQKIGNFKKEASLPVYDPLREEQLKNKNLLMVEESFRPYYSEIFDSILKVSKDIQL